MLFAECSQLNLLCLEQKPCLSHFRKILQKPGKQKDSPSPIYIVNEYSCLFVCLVVFLGFFFASTMKSYKVDLTLEKDPF